MATTTKPNRSAAQPATAPSAPPPSSVLVSPQGIPLRDYPGWDEERGGIVPSSDRSQQNECCATMQVEQTFRVGRRPEVVFDYMTNPANLASWQTSKTQVEQLTDGPPGLGTLIRERTCGPGGWEFEQIVEFAEFDRPRRLRAHIVEGPFPVDAVWVFESAGEGTLVHFETAGGLTGPARLLQPLARWLLTRRMAFYHENLRERVAALPGD